MKTRVNVTVMKEKKFGFRIGLISDFKNGCLSIFLQSALTGKKRKLTEKIISPGLSEDWK